MLLCMWYFQARLPSTYQTKSKWKQTALQVTIIEVQHNHEVSKVRVHIVTRIKVITTVGTIYAPTKPEKTTYRCQR